MVPPLRLIVPRSSESKVPPRLMVLVASSSKVPVFDHGPRVTSVQPLRAASVPVLDHVLLLPTLSVATADQAGAAVGTAIGYQNAAGNLGQAAGSAAAGLLFNTVAVAPFAVVAALMLLAAIIGWLLAHVRGQRLPPSAASNTESASTGDIKHGGA